MVVVDLYNLDMLTHLDHPQTFFQLVQFHGLFLSLIENETQ